MFDDKSPFDIFNLKHGFSIDIDELERQYLTMQAQFHPDRCVGKDPDETMHATAQSSLINKAYQTLKNPLTRAGLLASQQPSNNPEILMAAMELREAIESATDLTQIYSEVNNQIKAIEDQFDNAFSQNKPAVINDLYLQMQYLYKAKIEIKNKMSK